MGQTLGMRHNVLNAGSQKMPGNQTKHAHMSGNGAPLQKMDRRVRRTRNALGDALVALMHEKPFAAIRIQDVLDRAQISRSTFYTHYSDKDDLFLSDAEDFFEIMAFRLSRDGERSNRVAPMREMFAHVAEVRKFYATMVASGKLHDIFDSYGIANTFEIYPGTHTSAVAVRFQNYVLPFFAKNLCSGKDCK